MNNLENLVKKYAFSELAEFGNNLFLILMFLLLVIGFIVYFMENDFSFSGLLFVIFIVSLMFFLSNSEKVSKKSIYLKEYYNIEMKEKDELIEVNFKKEKRSVELKDNFKVYLEKTNEEKYYVYFDENKQDKKEVSLNEIKETFGNIKKVQSEKFSLSEINNEERK